MWQRVNIVHSCHTHVLGYVDDIVRAHLRTTQTLANSPVELTVHARVCSTVSSDTLTSTQLHAMVDHLQIMHTIASPYIKIDIRWTLLDECPSNVREMVTDGFRSDGKMNVHR
jgi:hypothetical protein